VSEPAPKTVPEVFADLWALTKEYARQETLDPIKDLGRYVGYGVGGAVLGGFGFVMLLLAALRALQTETGDFFDGDRSFYPYIIVIMLGLLAILLAVTRIKRNMQRSR
jgi:hypothetical protein